MLLLIFAMYVISKNVLYTTIYIIILYINVETFIYNIVYKYYQARTITVLAYRFLLKLRKVKI